MPMYLWEPLLHASNTACIQPVIKFAIALL